MRVRWRGLELPSNITTDAKFKSNVYARFSIEPFERGFGVTIGNSLRRVLLSSIQGAAPATLRIAGIKKHYPDPAILVGKKVIVVANLAPRKMRFGTSEGMVVASGPGGSDVFLLNVDSGAVPGQRVH